MTIEATKARVSALKAAALSMRWERYVLDNSEALVAVRETIADLKIDDVTVRIIEGDGCPLIQIVRCSTGKPFRLSQHRDWTKFEDALRENVEVKVVDKMFRALGWAE